MRGRCVPYGTVSIIKRMKKICLIISISIQAITNSFGQKIEFKVQFSQPLYFKRLLI